MAIRTVFDSPLAGGMIPAMATSPVELSVEYSVECPDCQKQGQAVKLGFSFESGGVICAAGLHRFERIPEDPTQQPEAEKRPTVRKLPAIALEVGPEPPAPTPDVVEQPEGNVQVLEQMAVAGGDMQVTVRLPEIHVSAVKAEAEMQGLTFAEYFQRFISDCLDNQWGMAPKRV